MSAVINDYIKNILTYVPIFCAVIVPFRIYRVKKLKDKSITSPAGREILMGVFLLWALAILSQTVLKDLDTFMADGYFLINTTPFNFTNYWHTAEYLVINVLGNILFFVPIGFLIPFLFRGNAALSSISGGFFLSAFIETCQIPLLRTTDIDDVILNTLGAAVGFMLYLIFIKYFPKSKEYFRVKK